MLSTMVEESVIQLVLRIVSTQARSLGGRWVWTNRPLSRKGLILIQCIYIHTDAYSSQNAPLDLYALLLCQILCIVFMQSLHFSSCLYNTFLIVVSIYLNKSAPWTQPYDCLFRIVNTCVRKPLSAPFHSYSKRPFLLRKVTTLLCAVVRL